MTLPTELGQAQAQISNAVYEATRVIEELEHTGRIRGNGHHIRQRIAKFAEDLLTERWEPKPDTESGSP